MEDIRIMNNFEKFAVLKPHAPAIMDTEGQFITYRQLNQTVISMTHFLSSRGIKINQRIAVIIPNAFEMAISFLAISNVASFVPLSPDYSLQQYRYYFEILKTNTLVVPTDFNIPLQKIAEEMNMTIYYLQKKVNNEPIYQLIGGVDQEGSHSVNLAQNDDIAMVNYTSGTTSKPKIVPRSHINVYYGVLKRLADIPLFAQDRVLIITPMFRTVGLNMLLAALGSGGCAICADNFEPGEFFRLIKETNPTWFTASPVVFQTIVDYAENDSIKDYKISLRFMRSSGAPLSKNLAQRIENLFKVPVYVTYGLTETGNIASSSNQPKGYKEGSAGVPTFLELGIVDKNGQLLSNNFTGEIVVRGPQVIKGYDDDEIMNMESFYDDWFRTGDKGYLDDDGYLFITGRFKEIINRGGEKVSPYEVEEAVNNHPDVLQNVVFPMPGAFGNEDVGVAVVLKEGKSLYLKDLRKFLKDKIVAFKMPTSLYIMKEIPVSDAGKVQRKMLFEEINALGIYPQPESDENEIIIHPRNEVEIKLYEIFKKILPAKDFSVTDSFFELGGDSLRAAVLYDRIKINFQIQIPLTYIFKNGSIEALAKFILNHNDNKSLHPFVVPFQEEGSKTPIFFVHSMKGEAVLYHHIANKYDPERPFYGISFNPEAGEWDHPITFEQMARNYIKDIRAIQPEGPYLLAGLCIGGIIAYEMARQLKEAKQEVSFLGLYDSIIKERNSLNITKIISKLKRRGFKIFIKTRLYHTRIKLLYLFYYQSPFLLKQLVFRFMDKDSIIKSARMVYEFKKYDGEITFFKPKNSLKEIKSIKSINIWSKLAQSIRIIDIQGNHDSVFYEENADNTRQVLEEILSDVP